LTMLTKLFVVWVADSLSQAPVIFKVAPKLPVELYTTVGFCAVELEGVPPGNDQA